MREGQGVLQFGGAVMHEDGVWRFGVTLYPQDNGAAFLHYIAGIT